MTQKCIFSGHIQIKTQQKPNATPNYYNVCSLKRQVLQARLRMEYNSLNSDLY